MIETTGTTPTAKRVKELARTRYPSLNLVEGERRVWLENPELKEAHRREMSEGQFVKRFTEEPKPKPSKAVEDAAIITRRAARHRAAGLAPEVAFAKAYNEHKTGSISPDDEQKDKQTEAIVAALSTSISAAMRAGHDVEGAVRVGVKEALESFL